MTRLVGVRAVCDACLAAAATHFCVDHQTVLCATCNVTENHSTHPCIDLASAVTALPFCEHCDDAPATTYCQAEGSALCDACDRLLHASNPSPHARTPIENTLRNRAVEFRGTPRSSSTPAPSSNQTPLSKSPTPPSKSPSPPPISKPLPSPSHRLPAHPVSTTSKLPPTKPSPAKPARAKPPRATSAPVKPTPGKPDPLAPSAQKRRPSKYITKRKTRERDRPKSTTPTLTAASPPELSVPPIRPQGLLDPAPQVPPLSYPPAASSTSTRQLSSASALTPHPLQDPLLADPATFFRQEHDRNLYMEADTPLIHNFDPILTYGSLDLSSNNALDPLAGVTRAISTSNSPPGSRRKGRDSQDVSLSADRTAMAMATTTGRDPTHAPQPNVVAAAAAAAAAAESFLLNSVSSGSRSSSGERAATPMGEGLDPAGVAEVATAAAESAVAAGELVGTGRGFRFGEEGLDLLGSSSGRGRGRGGRRSSGRRDSFEDEVRKLDMDSGGRGRVRVSGGLDRQRGEDEFLGHVHAEDDMLRGSGDMMGDLEMGSGEFGFDAMDLGGVDLHGGFALPDYRTRELEWDEGG